MRVSDLVSMGLPEFAVSELAAREITSLDQVQCEAVRQGLFEGQNLLVVAPTSCGKTLIGELAALHHATVRTGSILLTSHKALAYEKYLTFRDSYARADALHLPVALATGDEVTDESIIDTVSLTVATYEKWYYLLLDPKQAHAQHDVGLINSKSPSLAAKT